MRVVAPSAVFDVAAQLT